MKFLSPININTEYTLPTIDGANGQVLTTDGTGAVYWGNVSASATNLDGLTDVIITSPSSGQLLRYGIPPGSGEANPVWYNFTPNYLTPSSSIDNLGDVTITTATAGQILQWNGTAWVNATLSTVDYVSKVQHLVKCGVAVTKGQAVYVTSADGTNMIVGLASNASEATSSKVIGLAVSTGAINDQIFVVTEGLIAGLNTSTANAGDPVWLGTGGNLIFGLLNKPVAPAHLVYLGVVTRVQQNNGEIFVNVQNGFELHELHDVLISSPSTGQLIRRDSDGLWKNWTPNYLTSLPTHNHDDRYYTESEIIAFFGGETEIAGYNQTNWDTAYGWGNHATAGYLTSFTEADTLSSVTGRGNTTTNAITVGGATINGTWQTVITTTGGWNKLSFVASNAWGDGTTYGVLGAGGGAEPGVMTYNQHATWVGESNGAGIRMGRSGGVASGAWYQVATMGGDEFMIARNGQWANGGLKITSAGELQHGSGNKIWHAGNDGAASGLDADLLDGIDSSRFIYGQSGNRRGTNLISNWNQTDFPDVAFLSAEAGGTNAPTGDYIYGTQYSFHRDGAAYRTQLVTALYSDTSIYVRNSRDSDVWTSWKRLWHSGDFSSTNISNWNTAYGWGNHASAGYITASYLDDYTRGAYRVISDYNGNTTWYIRSNGQFIWGNGHDWTQSFRLNLSHSGGANAAWAYFGQQDSNETNGRYRGVRIRKYASGAATDGDISAAAYYIGDTRKDGNWDTAYSWGNHADAPYWNVSLNQDVQVEAQNVTFAGNVIIQGTLTESSSIRFKENIQPLEPSLAKVEQLNPVTYTKITSQEEEIGLIAEEVAELFPEVVTYNENGQPQGIQYQRLSVILLKAVQELTERVNKLENK
jgi:hypothetical protein